MNRNTESRSELSCRLQRARRRQLLDEHVPLAELFAQAPLARRLGLNAALFFLREHWPVIAGEALARHSIPWSLKEGVLRVRVDSPLHRQELTYASPGIARIAQDHLGPGAVQGVKAVLS